MASIKCEYCGHYMDDTKESCPRCGAVNRYYRRTAPDTPQTIEQLQSWYAARNLPPEHITRFFIGKDVKVPKAFGIYEEDGNYIVYKNKANGERAIRYCGRDEAYAVNELYLRLKEEILNQKSKNIQSRSLVRQGNNRKTSKKGKSLTIIMALAIIIALGPVLLIPFIMVRDIAFDPSFSSYSYYLTDDHNNLYYFEGYDYEDGERGYQWWKYDFNEYDWNKYARYDDDKTAPEGITKKNKYDSPGDVADILNMEYEQINVYDSKNYIDAGHHFEPSSAYHFYNNKLYYYLKDDHASYSDDISHSGWYVYDDDTWSYFCDYEDKDTLGEDLYYYDDEYRVYGSTIDDVIGNINDIPSDWQVDGFETTSWYEKYETHETAYDQYWEEKRNESKDDHDSGDWDWSNDSDYDWDSDSNWDSDWSDWDSDW